MTSKRVILTLAMVASFAWIAGSTSQAEAGRRFGIRFGHGHHGNHRNHGNWGHHGGHYDWHDTSHYDWHPGEYVRHRNHYHYVPGHWDYHRTGHWDYHYRH